MIVEVTKEDIINGKMGSCYFCPVAIAVKRKTGKEVNVFVGRGGEEAMDGLDLEMGPWLGLGMVLG